MLDLFSFRKKDEAEKIIAGWPIEARKLFFSLRKKYGFPIEVSAKRLTWFKAGQWKRIALLREGVVHQFPFRHRDHLEQTVTWQVPPQKMGDLVAFNGSLQINRTRGEVTICCNDEKQNTLALNIAYDLACERLDIEQARMLYAEMSLSLLTQESDHYADQLYLPSTMSENTDSDRELLSSLELTFILTLLKGSHYLSRLPFFVDKDIVHRFG